MENHFVRRGLLAVASASILIGCTGDQGPTGPAGPAGGPGVQGPQGQPGAPNVTGFKSVAFSGPLNAQGTTVRGLPLAAGSFAPEMRMPPMFFCYQLNQAGTAWESENQGGHKCSLSAAPG